MGGRLKRKIMAINSKGMTHVFNSLAEATERGYSRSAIANCASGRRKTHCGLKWEYVDEQTKEVK